MRKVFGLIVLLSSSVALADGYHWAVNGNGCVPTHETIQSGVYENRGVGVGFKAGTYGEIRLSCPISIDQFQDGSWGGAVGASFREWHKLFLSYRDEDGANSDLYVNVTLRYATFDEPAFAKTWASLTPAMPATYQSTLELDIKDVNPGLANYWWFEVRIVKKARAKGDVEFFGIAIN